MSLPRVYLALVVAALLLGACPADSKLPINSACSSDSSCATGYCIASLCLDPNADDDGDGLTNSIEGALGTNPKSADTDGDGISDYDEVLNANSPEDSDGDGKPDAVESKVLDADQDCIVDQYDPQDGVPETDPVVLAGYVCLKGGACTAEGAVISATCVLEGDKRVHHCDYSLVPHFEATEASCDEIDNDCDGLTDEQFTAGGTVTYTDDGTTGKVKGAPCGIGACSGGIVVCQGATALTCSTKGSGGAEVCDGVDNDCNGGTDEPFKAGGTVTFAGGAYAADAGKVLGASCGTGACAGGTVVCAHDDNASLACSTAGQASAEACDSVDNSCDGLTDQGQGLISCTNFFYDGDRDDYGQSDDSECLCAAEGLYTATAGGDCDDQDDNRSPGAAPICGVDADCDTFLLDAGEPCDDGDDELFGDGCVACAVTETMVDEGLQYRSGVAAAAFANGGFGICWLDQYATVRGLLGTSGVSCAFFDATGAQVGTFAADDSATAQHGSPQITALANGDVIVAWVEYDYTTGANHLMGQRLDTTGAPAGDPWRLDDVNYDTFLGDPVLTPLDAGAFAVAWIGEFYQTYTYELGVRAFDGANAPRFDSHTITGSGYLSSPALAGFDDGSFVLAWIDQDLEVYHNHLWMQRFAADGDRKSVV